MKKNKYTLHVNILLSVLAFLLVCSGKTQASELTDAFDQKVKVWAEQCRGEVIDQLNLLVSSGKLTTGALFDTFYIPIPNTSPQKFHTQYDGLCDQVIQSILDNYLNKDLRIQYVVAVDRNGYVPTHNSRFNQPLTGDPETDSARNRTKRLFNDRTGLEAARNKEPFLIQKYNQDTGEAMTDLSVPIFIHNQHWGAVRIGYKQQ